MADPRTRPLIGERYVLVERIAGGGMGSVWAAEDRNLERPVAVKVLHEGLLEDGRFVERFRHEARAAAGLAHPNVAGVFDYGEHEGVPYIVMELIRGETVAQRLEREGPLPPQEVARIGAEVADALATAHAAGLIHRDVKPANLMLTERGEAKVLDFGVAAPAGGTGLTGTGKVMGTAKYFSPEQALGQPATTASDLYALGVVLYELVSGSAPFDRETPLATAMAHVQDPPPPLRTTRPDVPEGLASAIERCLQKRPEDRPASAGELAGLLRAEAASGHGEQTAVLPATSLPAVRDGAQTGVATDAGVHPGAAQEAVPTVAGEVSPRGPVPPREAAPTEAVPQPAAVPPSRTSRRPAWVPLAVLVALGAVVVGVGATLGGNDAVRVPTLQGEPVADAVAALERRGLVARVVEEPSEEPQGLVIRQQPPGGSRAPQGSPVILVVSAGSLADEGAPATDQAPDGGPGADEDEDHEDDD